MSNWPQMLRRQVAGGAMVEWRKFHSLAEVEAGWSNDELDMARAVPTSSKWPSCRYPPGAGPAAGQIFQREEDVPEGWLDHPTGSDPAPRPAQEAPKNLQEASMRLARALDSVALLEGELRGARKANAALQEALDAAPTPASRPHGGDLSEQGQVNTTGAIPSKAEAAVPKKRRTSAE